jgi:DNA (cytosine-5)-methyltransferase 1
MEGQFTLFDYTMQMVSVDKPIRILELFAGYGSQSMALRNLGAEFETYRVVEFDVPAINSYNAVHGTNFPAIDIKDVHAADLAVVDKDKYTYLCTYSFPCTDISIAGQMKGMQEGSGTRSSLLWEVQRILDELKEEDSLPDILLMENVTAIHSDENMPHFQKWLNYLESIGYTTYVSDLNASDYGVAQNRDRTFAVSILGEYNYKFPGAIDLDKCIEDYFEDLSDEDALRLIVKSEKAMNLLVELDEDGKLD